MTVVVTGIGLNTGLGRSREESWTALREGRSAARTLGPLEYEGAAFDLGDLVGYPSAWPFDPLDPDQDRALSLLQQALTEAIADASSSGAGPLLDGNQDRFGVLVGLSKGALRHLGQVERLWRDVGSSPVGESESSRRLAQAWAMSGPNVGAALVSGWIGARGPCLAPIAACATGLVAALQGAELIRRGACDVAIVGASDASLNPFLLGAFRRMKALASLEGDPTAAVRPWDRRRSGFLVGEGAALLVLEREDRARARGARPYAEFLGGALGSDAYHETDLNPDPADLAGLIRRALDQSSTSASEIDLVNVHGTATRSNDPLECRALRQTFGRQADRISCSASKAQIGHLLGASGAVELAITCLAIRDGFVPPTINLTDPDPACDLDGTPLVGRFREIGAALKLSLGFGGHLAAAVLRRPANSRKGPLDAG